MSHADDGTLHAYLDGELSALEAVRVEAHLGECADCRRRLAEERKLVTRAGDLLAAAVPAERAAPPLRQLRHPRPGRRVRFPLAWAATLVLAVAVAWYVRPGSVPRPSETRQREQRLTPLDPSPPDSTPSAAVSEPAPKSGEISSADRQEAAVTGEAQATQPGQLAPAAPEPRAAAARDAAGNLAAARADAPPGPKDATLDTAAREKTAVAARSAAPTAQPAISRSPDLGAGAQLYPGTISAADARALLGTDLVAVPGLRVVSIRRARLLGYSPVVVVEQVLDSTHNIAVVHRRPAVPAAPPTAGAAEGVVPAPFARRADSTALVDSLAGLQSRVEIDVKAWLPPDSLSRLRAALRPLIRR